LESVKELYEIYEKYIFKYLYGLTLNYHVAEELTQETFLQVIKSFHKFRGDCHVSTWIYKIGRNVYFQYCRKNDSIPIPIDEDMVDNIPYRYGPDEALEKKEKTKLIIDAFIQISEKQREIIWLRDWQGFSYQEIASITNHPVSWVKVNIHRARVAFKKVYCGGGVLGE